MINPRDLKNTRHRPVRAGAVRAGERTSGSGSRFGKRRGGKSSRKTAAGVPPPDRAVPHAPRHLRGCVPAVLPGHAPTAPSVAQERVACFERLAEKEALREATPKPDTPEEGEEKRAVGEDDDASSSDAATAPSATKSPPRPAPLRREAKSEKRIPSPRKVDVSAADTAGDGATRAMVWVQVSGREETPEEGTSYVNRAEVAATVAAARRVRERHGPRAAIVALTFYKGQYLALMDAMPRRSRWSASPWTRVRAASLTSC